MFDIMFMRQKRNETAFIRSHHSQTAARCELTRADEFTRWWDGHASTKQRCEIQCEVLEFSDEHKWLADLN